MKMIEMLIIVVLYFMIGASAAVWAKDNEYPTWSRLLALFGWPLLNSYH